MKDFGRWFSDFSPPKQEVIEDESELPWNVNQLSNGEYEAKCCRCEEWSPLYCDISEILPHDGSYEHYCGGSPYCCP